MNILVTGSAGHLGEALMRTLPALGHHARGIDIRASPYTHVVGSISDRAFVKECMRGVEAVIHAATLHKPHIGTHSQQDFVLTNVLGTLNLLQEAVAAGVNAFVFTSTTSAFGGALTPPSGAPAAWITEDVVPVPRNIYGVTKTAAEDVCELVHRTDGMPCVILRTSRFFPEVDDNAAIRAAYNDTNVKVNEFLYRRVDVEDVVTAHVLALAKASTIGFERYIITTTTPFTREDLPELRRDAPAVVARHVPKYADVYDRMGWRMFPSIDRVYVNERAGRELGWQPRYDFRYVLGLIEAGEDPRSPLARAIGMKPYHAEVFNEGPYPVD
jgi:UDP-glucose 4-epimerase